MAPLEKNEFNKYKYINTINEINDNKQNEKLNINSSNVDFIKKEYYSSDDIKINNKNLNLINYSDIKNKGIQKFSKFSKLFGEESILSGNEKFLQAANVLNNNNNNNLNNNKNGKLNEENNNNDDNYEKNLKESNNNRNESLENSFISEKFDEKKNNLYKNKNKKNNIKNLSNENSENRKLKNSLNSSINSNNKLFSSKTSKQIQEDINNKNIKKILKRKDDKKSILSSSESLTETSSIFITDQKKNFSHFYCDYFIQREIFLITFYHKHDNVSLFIRLPTFFISIGFIFTLSCLFLTESDIHRRYEYYNEHGKINEMKYAFKYNIGICFAIGIISIVFKMICIKLVYFVIFKIKKEIKDEFSPFVERSLTQIEMNEIKRKKKKYIKQYKKRSIIFMIIIFILLIFFAYISICYMGAFHKSIYGILINFIISVIFSFIICAFLCCVISIFYAGGCNKIFNFLKIIY